jgi:hypothetical protein
MTHNGNSLRRIEARKTDTRGALRQQPPYASLIVFQFGSYRGLTNRENRKTSGQRHTQVAL